MFVFFKASSCSLLLSRVECRILSYHRICSIYVYTGWFCSVIGGGTRGRCQHTITSIKLGVCPNSASSAPSSSEVQRLPYEAWQQNLQLLIISWTRDRLDLCYQVSHSDRHNYTEWGCNYDAPGAKGGFLYYKHYQLDVGPNLITFMLAIKMLLP